MDLSRLSLNSMTCDYQSLPELVEACAKQGISWIAPWRHKIEEIGIESSARVIQEYGLKVSSVCRGGMFPVDNDAEFEKRLEENKRAIDEAARLDAESLVLVCGGIPDRDIDKAREMVKRAIEKLIPYAEKTGVKLGIEPLHPAFAADRSVIVTLNQAMDLVETFQSPQVGVIIDVYHVWWDPELYPAIKRASGHILGFHVNDWAKGGGDPLTSRAMMGDGVIEIQRIEKAVIQAGYSGPIEVEILNDKIWSQPYEETLTQIKKRFLEYV